MVSFDTYILKTSLITYWIDIVLISVFFFSGQIHHFQSSLLAIPGGKSWFKSACFSGSTMVEKA